MKHPLSDTDKDMIVMAAKAGGEISTHYMECWNEGAGLRVWEKIEAMEKENATRDKLLAEFVGAQKLARWLVPVVTGVLSSSLAVWLLRASISGLHR